MSITDSRTYPVFVDPDVFQIRIKQQLSWFDVDRRLAFSFIAYAPFRVQESPEVGP